MEKIDVKALVPCYNTYKEHGGSLDALEYDRVSYKAMKYIGYVTLNRAYAHITDDDDILYCHAELCNQYSAIDALQARINAAEDVTSETVGPHTVHYATASNALQTAQEALYNICKRYLLPYMYRGVRCV